MRVRSNGRRGLIQLMPVFLLIILLTLSIVPFQSLLPRTTIGDAFTVQYESQYDSSGTKDLTETDFTHTAPSGWDPSSYRVTLSQVTTWDDYSADGKDDDYASHTFEGTALTNEETYYVSFDFGDGTTPVLTRTGDPADSASITPGVVVDDYLIAGDWTGCQNWVLDTNAVGGSPEDGYWNDADDIMTGDGWTWSESGSSACIIEVTNDANRWEESPNANIIHCSGADNQGTMQLYKDFQVTSENNVWIGGYILHPYDDNGVCYMQVSVDSSTTTYIIRYWYDTVGTMPADSGNTAYVIGYPWDTAGREYGVSTHNVSADMYSKHGITTWDNNEMEVRFYLTDTDNGGYGEDNAQMSIDSFFIHGQDDGAEFLYWANDYDNGDGGYYNTVGWQMGNGNDDDKEAMGYEDNLPDATFDEDSGDFYWDWELQAQLSDDSSTDYEYLETQFRSTDGTILHIRLCPTVNSLTDDQNGDANDYLYIESDDTSGQIDLSTVINAYEVASSEDIDELYGLRADNCDDDPIIVEKWAIYEGHTEAGADTFDVSDMDDPTGCEFNSVQVDVTGGDAGYTLQNTDLTLSDDWSGWSVSGATGNGNSGSWTVSGSWLDVDSTLNVEFADDVNDGDGYTINYSNCNVGCSVQDIGLNPTAAMDTAFNFDADGATISYDNEGGTIVYEVDLDTTDGMSGAKTIGWEEDNYAGGDITDWAFTYDLDYQVRDYVSCQDVGITINNEAPDSYLAGGGCRIISKHDLDNTIEFGETGDEIPDNDIANSIFTVSVEGDYIIEEDIDLEADDDDIGSYEARWTETVTPDATPTYNSFAVTFRFSSEYIDMGKINVGVKEPSSGMMDLDYLLDYTVVEGSTKVRVKRTVFSGSTWDTGEYEFWIRFTTDEDTYYELTNTEADDEIGIRVLGWEKYTDIVVSEGQNTYIMLGELDNVDVREEFCFSIGQEIPNVYAGHISKVEIWRYETTSNNPDGIFTNIYETTPNDDMTKFWSVYHVSPKYDDYLAVYLHTPTMEVSKVYESMYEYNAYKRLDVTVDCWEVKVDNIYLEVDLVDQKILPQRYNYLILEYDANGDSIPVQGVVRDYKLQWRRPYMNKGQYHYTILLTEKTTSEKINYMWNVLTQQEIVTGGITLVTEGAESWEPPQVDVPQPTWRLPEFELPSFRVDIQPIDWGRIGDRIINYGRYASGYSAIVQALIVSITLIIVFYQLNMIKKQETASKKETVARLA